MPDNNGDLGVAPGGYPLGLIPSPPDERDYRYPAYAAMLASDEMPEEYWQGVSWPEVRDQGAVQSCVAFAGTALREVQEAAEIGRGTAFSRQFSYAYRPNKYYHQGPGMVLREYFAVLRDCGVPPEGYWPGMVEKGKEVLPAPFDPVLEAAKPHRIGSYVAVNSQDILEFKSACWVRHGVVIGIPVHSNFIPDSDGNIPLPKGNLLGYHGMYAPRWLKGRWIVLNSYSENWGGITLPDGSRKPGYCYLPWDYPIIEARTTVDQTTVKARTLLIVEGEPVMWVDGRPTEPKDLAPFIHADRFVGAFRHIAEGLGAEVEGWGRYTEGQYAGRMWAKFRKVEYPWP